MYVDVLKCVHIYIYIYIYTYNQVQTINRHIQRHIHKHYSKRAQHEASKSWVEALSALRPEEDKRAERCPQASEPPTRAASGWVSWDPSFALHIKTHV